MPVIIDQFGDGPRKDHLIPGPDNVFFTGYFPGATGLILEAHGRYYHEAWGFDASFEAQEGAELSKFLDSFTDGRDFMNVATSGGDFAGSIAVDGAVGGPDEARLRWFLVLPLFQGRGIGKFLISSAMDFCRSTGHTRVHLWTFEGLDVALRLYRKEGFKLVEQQTVRRWGRETIKEQKLLVDLDRE